MKNSNRVWKKTSCSWSFSLTITSIIFSSKKVELSIFLWKWSFAWLKANPIIKKACKKRILQSRETHSSSYKKWEMMSITVHLSSCLRPWWQLLQLCSEPKLQSMSLFKKVFILNTWLELLSTSRTSEWFAPLLLFWGSYSLMKVQRRKCWRNIQICRSFCMISWTHMPLIRWSLRK